MSGELSADEPAIISGDQVAAASDIDTTRGTRIPAGTPGTVAEDRGSRLVVFFDSESQATQVDDSSLIRIAPPGDAPEMAAGNGDER